MSRNPPLIERPDPNRVYRRNELRPRKLEFAANNKDTFKVRPVNIWRLNPVVRVEVT